MPGPVREFMQCSAVVARSILERLLGGQVDAVTGAAVEGSVTLVVRNPRTGVHQDTLAALDSFKIGLFRSRIGWNTIDLFGIEHRGGAMYQAPVRLVLGRIALVRLGRLPPGLVFHFPILDVCAAFSLFDLPALLCGLFVRHPPRILVDRKSTRLNSSHLGISY